MSDDSPYYTTDSSSSTATWDPYSGSSDGYYTSSNESYYSSNGYGSYSGGGNVGGYGDQSSVGDD